MPRQKNEGEGNKTAARHYNEKTQAYVKSGKVEKAAAEAARAVDSPEGKELEAARGEASRHAHDHDPEEMRDYRKKS